MRQSTGSSWTWHVPGDRPAAVDDANRQHMITGNRIRKAAYEVKLLKAKLKEASGPWRDLLWEVVAFEPKLGKIRIVVVGEVLSR
jgi:hypothetical protein